MGLIAKRGEADFAAMAQMHPEDIEDYATATEGEKRVFRFIREAARPQGDFICWYQPFVGASGKEPDFLLFGKKLGLLVIEVKDWTVQQILAYTPHHFTVLVSGKPETRTNPDKQAKGYVDALQTVLKTYPGFISEDPDHLGKLRIPIGRIVVFPNISREEYANSDFKWLLESERFLCGDDLAPTGKILRDTSGQKFFERVSAVLPFRFGGIQQKAIEDLCRILWSEAKIDLPARLGTGKARFRKEVLALDNMQARLALRLSAGHQIFKGPPGSGKTLVLVHRACHLARYNPRVEGILLVCFNIALAGYLRRLVLEKGVGIGARGIDVCHFFELCARVLGEPVHFENEESDYYDVVKQETLDRILNGHSRVGRFGAVFVDEGQDFDAEMLKVLLNLVRPGGDLVIAADSYQDLYRRDFSWKSLGISASGRTHYLRKAYRSAMEIFDFTQRFIGITPKIHKQLALLPFPQAFQGGSVELKPFRNFAEIEAYLTDDLKKTLAKKDYKRSEIAVLYDDKVYGPSRFAYDNRALPMRLLSRLEASGIPAAWVSQDVRAKEAYDMTTDRVSVISIHSAKGLEFDLVYLVGVDRIRLSGATRGALVSLLYVAMTRAKYRLVIPYVEETELISRMRACLPA